MFRPSLVLGRVLGPGRGAGHAEGETGPFEQPARLAALALDWLARLASTR